MKIGIELSAAVLGRRGTRRYASMLPAALAEIDTENEYRLLYVYFRGALGEKFHAEKYPNFRNRVWRIPPRVIYGLRKKLGWPGADSLLGKADMIHYASQYLPARKPVKKIFTVHSVGFGFLDKNLNPNFAAIRAEYDKAARECEFFITVSAAMKTKFLELYPFVKEENVRPIHFGISPEFAPLDEKAAREIVEKRFGLAGPYILFSGAVQKDKSIGLLVQMISILKKRRPDLKLAIAGELTADAPEYFELALNFGVENDIKFLGYVAPDAGILPALYKCASVYVHPSLWEGWSSPPMEALASGTPVVASKIPPLEEQLGDAAVLVPDYSPEAFADSILKVLDDTGLRASLVSKGRGLMKSYTWSECAKKHLEFYRYVHEH